MLIHIPLSVPPQMVIAAITAYLNQSPRKGYGDGEFQWCDNLSFQSDAYAQFNKYSSRVSTQHEDLLAVLRALDKYHG